MLRPLLYSIIVAILVTVVGGSSPKKSALIYEVERSWDKAFHASIQFKVKHKIRNGWRLRIEFIGSLRRLECWEGVVGNAAVNSQYTIYRITNKTYNGIWNKGSIFQFKFNGWFPEGVVDPKPPPAIIYFQNVMIYRSPSLLARPKSTPLPNLGPAATTDIIHALTNFLNSVGASPPQSQNPRDTGNGDDLFNLLDNRFSPVEPWNGNETFNYQDRTNQLINERNAEINRLNDLKNEGNTTDGNATIGNTTDPNVLEGSADVESYTFFANVSSTVASQTTAFPSINVTSKYDYQLVLHKSLLFYEAQRSGKLPDDKRLAWTVSSALTDRGRNGEDLSGGYYDAGDYVKFGFPMAFSVTMLAWGVIEYWDVYEQLGELQNALDALKWGTDYFIKAHVSKYELYGQVGNPEEEHKTWGRPEAIPPSRPSYSISKKKPGSDLAGETTAALAAVSIAMRKAANGQTTPYVEELLQHATDLYTFARNFQRKYHLSIKAAQEYYTSTSYKDELVWAAAWLYRATGDSQYLKWAEGQYQNWALFFLPQSLKFSWDDKRVGIQLLLAQVSTVFKRRYESTIASYCNSLRSSKASKTPKGLLYLGDWSPLRYASNSIFVCLMAADYGINEEENRLFGQFQIHYMLGDSGRSYLVGFGENYPKALHHRASTCPPRPQHCGWHNYKSHEPNPTILEGALVGGPDAKDQFKDDRKDVKQSEVALDYNAGFQGAIVALQYRAMFPDKNISRSEEPWYKTYLEEIEEREETDPDDGNPDHATATKSPYIIIFAISILASALIV